MSTIKNRAAGNGAPVSHAEAAQERLSELQRMRELIPHFVIPVSSEETRQLASAAAVPRASSS